MRPSLTAFSGALAGVLMVLYVSEWLSMDASDSTGVPVGLLIRGDVFSSATPETEAVFVRMSVHGGVEHPDLYVDGELVAWEDFDAALLQAILRRPWNWPVYVLGDRELDWQWVAEVIARIRAVPSEVILLTPKTMREAAESRASQLR